MRESELIEFGEAPFTIIDGDRGKNYPKQSDFQLQGHCLFLSATNVTRDGFEFEQCQFISEQKDEAMRKGKLAREDVILTTRGTIGNAAYFSRSVPFDFMRINSGMVILRCERDKILPRFLYNFLRSPKFHSQVNSLRSGAAQPQLPIRDMKRIALPLPEVTVQRAIVEILSSYDDLIENNRRRIELLEQSARLLYKEWFVHLRFPGHEHVTITNGIPDGWEPKTVPEVIDINPTERAIKGDEIRYFPMGALSTTGMTVDMSESQIRTKSTSVKFRNGDTLFARITPCLENGKTGFTYFLMEGELACGSTEFIVLRGREVSQYFTYCLARTHEFRGNAIKSMIGSSGRQRVQKTCFDEFLVPLPTETLRSIFDESTEPIFKQIAGLVRQNDALTTARDLLLPRLMNGEIAV